MIWTLIIKIRKYFLYRILKLTTYGVRVLLYNNQKILLIKHRYDDFWVFPGGGIKKHEDPEFAAIRECIEETGYVIQSTPIKLGIYSNISGGKTDIVHVYTSNDYAYDKNHKSLSGMLEVSKQEWFSINDLPTVSKATQRRIEEFISNTYSDDMREW